MYWKPLYSKNRIPDIQKTTYALTHGFSDRGICRDKHDKVKSTLQCSLTESDVLHRNGQYYIQTRNIKI